jgi:hypothetical protein
MNDGGADVRRVVGLRNRDGEERADDGRADRGVEKSAGA